MSSGDAPDADDAVALEMAPPTAAPAQVRAAAKARLLAASLGTTSATPERERIAGRYRLIREIGRGGIGSVWEAELSLLGKRTAIKLLRGRVGADAGEHEARLLREAQAASAIGHEHIVRVDDFGIDPDAGPFLVMELLSGRSLASEIAMHAPMPWPRVAGILLQLCSALAAAHRVGIVHRDLKPANVFLVRRDGGADHCKLLDFGLCKPPPDDGASPVLTAMGTRMGTPGYMAPEQIRGEEVDGRADLYALGCIAYEMLCGRPPFASRRAADLVTAHLEHTPPSLRELVPSLPQDAAHVIEHAMAKDRATRFADAETMANEIRGLGMEERAIDRTLLPAARARATDVHAAAPSRQRSRTTLALAVCAAAVLTMVLARDEPRSRLERIAFVRAPVPVATPRVPTDVPVPERIAPASVIPQPVAAPSPAPESSSAALPRRPTRRPLARDVVAESPPLVPPSVPPAAPEPVRTPSKPHVASPRQPRAERLVDNIRDPFGAHSN